MHSSLNIERIREGFQLLKDWDQRYQFLIDLGAKLTPMDDSDKTDANRVHACMSLVWITTRLDTEQPSRVTLLGDSETATIKGIVAVLVTLYSGKTAAEIADLDADVVFDELGLFDHLSPTRHVGVYAMVEHIKRQAFKAGECAEPGLADTAWPSRWRSRAQGRRRAG